VIRESGKSVEEVARDAGIAPIVISGFLSGQRDIRMTTADKLADVLGLMLAT
jgi:plasmid maintenance system antidote protein VapI